MTLVDVSDHFHNKQQLPKFHKMNKGYSYDFVFWSVKDNCDTAYSQSYSTNLNIDYFIFAGSQSSIDKFFLETNSVYFEYSKIPTKQFLKITNGKMPLIVLLEEGKINSKYGYRDIVENEIIEFIKK